MNNQLDATAYLAGHFISEDAVRAALDRRSRTVPTRQPQPLRRWSVAELVARAAARAATDGVTR